eukprot:GILJ01021672.1.p1 GENE.GILJ01021672.1~~GILJ01021672.1.p1  ORF type:complete len:722 (+),score=86.08 GILJ01021672.1:489-2654(+)
MAVVGGLTSFSHVYKLFESGKILTLLFFSLCCLLLLNALLCSQEQEEALKAKQRFTSNISHELRTPLNGIIGCMEMMMETGLKPNQRELAATCLQSGENMLGLVNDLLDYAKLEANFLRLVKTSFDIRQTARDVMSSFSSLVDSKGLSIKLEIDDAVPRMVSADHRRLKQMLCIYISNAVHFTEQGSITVVVQPAITAVSQIDADSSPTSPAREEIETLNDPALLCFSVIDTGVGIPESEANKLFTPFGRLQHVKQGTGVGLVICKRLAEMMGGSAGYRRLDNGSMFWFTIRNSAEPFANTPPMNWSPSYQLPNSTAIRFSVTPPFTPTGVRCRNFGSPLMQPGSRVIRQTDSSFGSVSMTPKYLTRPEHLRAPSSAVDTPHPAVLANRKPPQRLPVGRMPNCSGRAPTGLAPRDVATRQLRELHMEEARRHKGLQGSDETNFTQTTASELPSQASPVTAGESPASTALSPTPHLVQRSYSGSGSEPEGEFSHEKLAALDSSISLFSTAPVLRDLETSTRANSTRGGTPSAADSGAGAGATVRFCSTPSSRLKTLMTLTEVPAETALTGPIIPDMATVLIAEDNPFNQHVATEMLKCLKFHSEVANNGVECLDMFKADPLKYCMILMDCHMPEMDGFAATRNIRMLEKAKGLPKAIILGLTADNRNENIKDCIDAGMDDVITKPFRRQELHKKIVELMSATQNEPSPTFTPKSDRSDLWVD